MEFTGIDQAESFARAVAKVNGVGNDAAVEVDIGFAIDGDITERGHGMLGVWG
jgi:hypothetical protein